MRLVCSLYDFSTFYYIIPHILITETLLDLTERAYKKIFKNEGKLYHDCTDKKVFFQFYRPERV